MPPRENKIYVLGFIKEIKQQKEERNENWWATEQVKA